MWCKNLLGREKFFSVFLTGDLRQGFSALNEEIYAREICQRMHGENMPGFLYIVEGSGYQTMKGCKFPSKAAVTQEMCSQILITSTVCGGEERSEEGCCMFLLAPTLYMYSINVFIWYLLLLIKTWFHKHLSLWIKEEPERIYNPLAESLWIVKSCSPLGDYDMISATVSSRTRKGKLNLR